MDKIKIERATLDNADYISLLGRITFTETFSQYFRDYQDLLDYYEKTFSVSKIKLSLQKGNNLYWIAFYEDLPVGYAKLKMYSKSEYIDSDNVAQLQKIYVLKDFISKKIGHNLLFDIIEEIRKKSIRFLWLSVLKTNERAISFYKKNGFTKIGEHTFDIGKEHFIFSAMKLNLKNLLKI